MPLFFSILLAAYYCFFMSFGSFAQTGNCVVFAADNTAFYLGIDNKFQNSIAQSNIKISAIPEGDYWVTILFYDPNQKAIKTNLRVIEDKEIAYQLTDQGGVWKLQQYSAVPKSQVKTLQTGQTVLPFDKIGVEVQGLKSADQIAAHKIAQQESIQRVQGNHKDHAKRTGQYSSDSASTGTNQLEQEAKNPATGTSIINEFIAIINTDGTTKIVDQRTTITKEIVERNGQKQLRTQKSKSQVDTDFNCLPLAKDSFLVLKTRVASASDKVAIVQQSLLKLCLTPNQIKTIGDLFDDKETLNNYAQLIQSTCASPGRFPYDLNAMKNQEEPLSDVEEVNKTTEEIVEQEIEREVVAEVKTAAELKAELKALKIKAKLEKKLKKQQAKIARKAAKKRAKEAKIKK